MSGRPKRTIKKVVRADHVGLDSEDDWDDVEEEKVVQKKPKIVKKKAPAAKAAASGKKSGAAAASAAPGGAASSVCQHCGEPMNAGMEKEECLVTRKHKGDWDYDYDPGWYDGPPNPEKGTWLCCGSSDCLAVGCGGGEFHSEGVYVSKKPQYTDFIVIL
eukprot:m.6886 g.6886  ORF g.6886 m.6886 type:complete len:160 (-) comp4877_c0_seq1:251-730(-)